jgi:hypothetical protein
MEFTLRVPAYNCHTFCQEYSSNSTIIDTEVKYATIYKMVQRTNREQNIRWNYIIGLKRSKLVTEQMKTKAGSLML